MPTKDNIFNICVYTEEGQNISLGKSLDISIDESEITDSECEKFNFSKEVIFEIGLHNGFCTRANCDWPLWWVSRCASNNWRKLHGLPMRRKHGNSKKFINLG